MELSLREHDFRPDLMPNRMTDSHPTGQIPTGVANDRCGAFWPVPVAKAVRPLCDRRGDRRRDRRQWERCAGSKPSRPRLAIERLGPKLRFAARKTSPLTTKVTFTERLFIRSGHWWGL